MKKLFSILMALFVICGCTKAQETTNGVYEVYNTTGENVVELYIYKKGEDKGENYAATPIEANGHVQITTTEDASKAEEIVYTLEFKTEEGESQTFNTLAVEQVSIYLKNLDTQSGATVISFEEPEETASYKFVNKTGSKVISLYVYEADATDKGENYAGDGLDIDEEVIVEFTELATQTSSKVYVVEFEAENSDVQKFETLHFEVATMNLRNIDEAAGATQVEFTY